MLARLMQGLLVSIGLAVAVAIFDFLLGVSIGVLAGYYGGFLDQFLARFTDLNLAFPTLLFLIMLAGIGLGIQPPGSSLGLMIASATPNITVYPYEILLPSAVLTILVLAFSFLGDAIQDAFSPQQV
ncbi:MAG TPA: hypothetical protein VKV19_05905 [Ktedonobacteraceae bacterium]|jgi:ABC-type dipeptide/oligopeptide/nickel transport system permease subunit|nr:hypothetical protein [Ktedonobacteraceae bacterium]